MAVQEAQLQQSTVTLQAALLIRHTMCHTAAAHLQKLHWRPRFDPRHYTDIHKTVSGPILQQGMLDVACHTSVPQL